MVGDGTQLNISRTGSILFPTNRGKVEIPNVLHVPGLCKNLIFIRCLANDLNCSLSFDANGFNVKGKDGVELLSGNSTSRLYQLGGGNIKGSQALIALTVPPVVWHNRLGHLAQPILKKILSQFPSRNHISRLPFCSICAANKAKKLPFSQRSYTAKQPFEIIHLDLWGPSPVVSREGYRYYAAIVDHTRYTWFIPLVLKSQLLEQFVWFFNMVKQNFNFPIKCIRSDARDEFTSSAFIKILASKGIRRHLSCPYTPEQNGIVERKHDHIGGVGRCFLHQAGLTLKFWSYVFNSAVFTINCLPSSNTNNLSPYELLYHRTPDITLLRTFGC